MNRKAKRIYLYKGKTFIISMKHIDFPEISGNDGDDCVALPYDV